MTPLPEGLIAVVKKECQTCEMVRPVLARLDAGPAPLTVYTQDDAGFPDDVSNRIDDTDLSRSFALAIEVVPTLIRIENGRETGRIIGWDRSEWRQFTGMADLGADLPDRRPGCGALNVMPGIAEELTARLNPSPWISRRIALAEREDDIEACYHRGWSDGLPVVPPTPERVAAMMKGTRRPAEEVVAIIPPDQGRCTIEKAAINAVMAGCKPEYFPVVLAAVEAACEDTFCMHGLLATTYFSSPVIVVNGPIVKAIGMNSGINALGQGNRANATIGRALQLIIRNVGGGRPGGVDRAALGNPGKYTFCFAEAEDTSPWEPLSVEQGFGGEKSTVTLFGGDGVQAVVDQISRTPESLARSFAACLRTVAHPKLFGLADAMLVVSPEHGAVFQGAGWSRQRLREEIGRILTVPGSELVRGAGGIAEGMPAPFAPQELTKFRPGGLLIVHAGGRAGKFSAIVGGWLASGPVGSQPVTKEIST